MDNPLVMASSDRDECLKNIRRLESAKSAIDASREWLDVLCGHTAGNMSLRLKQYTNLLIIDIGILELELENFKIVE